MRRGWWLVVAVVACSGCGAMINGPQQTVQIATIPQGAKVTVDGEVYKSPARVKLDRGRNYAVKAEMAGFNPGTGKIVSKPDRFVIFGNCLMLCIPQIWEGGDPSQYKFEPDEIEISLDPIGWSPR
jgi:PEGA domain